MPFSRFLNIAILTLVLAVVSLCQEQAETRTDTNISKPKFVIKVDEFGRAGDEDVSARTDNLMIQIHNNPASKGYIIAYRGLDLLPSDYDRSPTLERIRKALAFRKYDISELVFIDGGFRETITTEFFLVPLGGVPPKPTKTVPKPKMPNDKTFLWGKSIVGGWSEDTDPLSAFILPEIKAKQDAEQAAADAEMAAADLPEEKDAESQKVDDMTAVELELSPEEKEGMQFSWANEKFGSELAKRKNASGVLIFYADDQYYDIYKLRNFVELGREYIARKSNIAVSRIQVVYGGYRDQPTGEFWIIPANGEMPVAKPEERDAQAVDAK